MKTTEQQTYTPEQMRAIHEQIKATLWIIFLFVAAIITIAIYI